ncbi:MAG: plastocyanin/azurin family copper-binding protein [Solirubrobacterales bacterium]
MAICVLAAGPAGSSASRTASASVGARISVMDNYFDPRSVTVERGEAVRWTWGGASRHNVVFTKATGGATRKNVKARRSGNASRTFSVTGTYRYVCTLYEGMQGGVKVTP